MKGSTKGTMRLLIGVAGTFVLMQVYHVATMFGIDRDFAFLISALVITIFNRWYWRTMDMPPWPRQGAVNTEDELRNQRPSG